jgi:phosphopantothenoylcysteine decarboxylase/phosphopantothenate--cysteine ligase
VLGVCGGVAAYKAAELVRLLKQRAEVRVVMTASAQQFVTPLTFQALSGAPVHTHLWDAEQERGMGHIELARWADCLLIAPATANTLSKLAHGIADDLLTTLYLAAACPVWVAPAMNQAMWRKAVVQENIARLQQHGVRLLGPDAGEQACGDYGLGRMREPAAICQALFDQAQSGSLQGKRVLITAGPTREPLDPVRFISNRSSGKMGYALAVAAKQAGAEVTLVSGPVTLSPPVGIKTLAVETAAEMYQAVWDCVGEADIFIGAAAVADYRPQTVAIGKIKKQADTDQLVLEPTTDIIAAVAARLDKPFTVGFAAETDDLAHYAQAKLTQKRLDMIAANWVGGTEGGFDSDQNALHVYWPGGDQPLAMADKTAVAVDLIALIAQRFSNR